jgi:hypothetical protein
MSLAIQKHLPIKLEYTRPVVDFAAALAICGKHEQELRAIVDCAEIPAWNISRFGDAGSVREIRILAAAVRNLAAGKDASDFDDDLILLRLYGRHRPLLTSSYLARCWHCDPIHISRLIKDKTLISVQPLSQGIIADVTWASALAFLHARRIR